MRNIARRDSRRWSRVIIRRKISNIGSGIPPRGDLSRRIYGGEDETI